MWPRHMELMLGLWMAVSPFVFDHPPGRPGLWVHDFAVATVLVTVPLLTYWHPLRRAHLTLLLLAVWLCGHGWWRTLTAEASVGPYQNWLTVGLLLAMFAIIPTEASRPPETWQRRS